MRRKFADGHFVDYRCRAADDGHQTGMIGISQVRRRHPIDARPTAQTIPILIARLRSAAMPRAISGVSQ